MDETVVNINGKRHWLHTASTSEWTYFYAHESRGKLALDEIDILPHYQGILIHDHWQSYFKYDCQHAMFI